MSDEPEPEYQDFCFEPFEWADNATEIEQQLLSLWPQNDDGLARCGHELEYHAERLYVRDRINTILPLIIASYGNKGIERLAKILMAEGLSPSKKTNILRALWSVACGAFEVMGEMPPDLRRKFDEIDLTEEIQDRARRVFYDFVAWAVSTPFEGDILGGLFTMDSFAQFINPKVPSVVNGVVQAIQSFSFRLSPSLLQEFGSLIQSQNNEEVYQQFFEAHPVLLDPLAKNLITKHKLGSDFITDFVAVRLTGDYLIVEIEKPSTPIFYSNGDFHRDFMHGLRQVLDFQEWLAQNVAYAQSKLPGIKSPQGLLVVGKVNGLSDPEKARLNRFRKEHHSIEILGYDELLEKAQTLYNNLRGS